MQPQMIRGDFASPQVEDGHTRLVNELLEAICRAGFSARQVHRLYEALPLVEQRVIQAQYTRRAEYGDLPAHLRQDKACRVIGIALPYYKVALGSFQGQVWREFI